MVKTIEEKARKYALSQVLSCTDTKMTEQAYLSIRMFNGYDVACGYKDGAESVLKVIEKELNRAFLNDFNDFSAHERDIAQGVIGQIKIFVEQLKGE